MGPGTVAIRGITERRRAETALQNAYARLSASVGVVALTGGDARAGHRTALVG
jgi:hypothetical protein